MRILSNWWCDKILRKSYSFCSLLGFNTISLAVCISTYKQTFGKKWVFVLPIMTIKRGRIHKLQTWRCPRRNLCNVLLGPGSPHTEYKCPTFGIAVHIKFRQAFLLCFIFSLNWKWRLWLIGKTHSLFQPIICLVIRIKLK